MEKEFHMFMYLLYSMRCVFIKQGARALNLICDNPGVSYFRFDMNEFELVAFALFSFDFMPERNILIANNDDCTKYFFRPSIYWIGSALVDWLVQIYSNRKQISSDAITKFNMYDLDYIGTDWFSITCCMVVCNPLDNRPPIPIAIIQMCWRIPLSVMLGICCMK